MAQISTSPWLILFLAALAVWRVTHLLHAEDGPFDLLVRLRSVLGHGFWGTLMDCFYCLSMWLAAPTAWLLCQNVSEWLLLWLALSGAAIFLERLHSLVEKYTEKMVITPLYTEDPPPAPKEDYDGMLRK